MLKEFFIQDAEKKIIAENIIDFARGFIFIGNNSINPTF